MAEDDPTAAMVPTEPSAHATTIDASPLASDELRVRTALPASRQLRRLITWLVASAFALCCVAAVLALIPAQKSSRSADVAKMPLSTEAPRVAGTEEPVVLLISLDGFRHSYLETYASSCPTLLQLKREGFGVRMQPAFPSKTFPNHYTIVTGLYPESHGIIANSMIDPVTSKRFSLSSSEVRESMWWGGEPIWVTAERHGKRSACYFWPGSEAAIGPSHSRPTEYIKYNSSAPFEDRVKKVLSWLDQPAPLRPSVITLYFEEPDHAGHTFGPDNEAKIRSAIGRVDGALALLVSALDERRLREAVNLIIVSDHGMTRLDGQVNLDELRPAVNMSDFDVIDWGVLASIRPHVGKEAAVWETLLSSAQSHPHLQGIYHRSLRPMPARFHYGRSERIMPILLLAKRGFKVSTSSRRDTTRGEHGYDNEEQDMQAILIASGAAFKSAENAQADADIVARLWNGSIPNTEVYNLMTEILHFTRPAANNGSGALALAVLKESTRLRPK